MPEDGYYEINKYADLKVEEFEVEVIDEKIVDQFVATLVAEIGERFFSLATNHVVARGIEEFVEGKDQKRDECSNRDVPEIL